MFRPLDEYLNPDPRHAVEVLVDESTGSCRHTGFQDWYAGVSDLNLAEPVPQDIINQFDKARNAFVLSWFAFDLTTVAELQAYLTLEMALWTRLEIDPRAKGAPRLSGLLKRALADGVLTASDFERAHPAGQMPEMLIEMLVRQRNDLSHGSSFLFANYSGMALEICAVLIGALFRQTWISRNRRYSAPGAGLRGGPRAVGRPDSPVSQQRLNASPRPKDADAVQVMSENPYRLARDIRGIGFRTADSVRSTTPTGSSNGTASDHQPPFETANLQRLRSPHRLQPRVSAFGCGT